MISEVVTPVGTVMKNVIIVVYTKYVSKHNYRRWKICIIRNNVKRYFLVTDEEYVNYVVDLGAKCYPIEVV